MHVSEAREQREMMLRRSDRSRRGLGSVLGHLFRICSWGLTGPEGGLASVAAADSALRRVQEPGQDRGGVFLTMKRRCMYQTGACSGAAFASHYYVCRFQRSGNALVQVLNDHYAFIT